MDRVMMLLTSILLLYSNLHAQTSVKPLEQKALNFFPINLDSAQCYLKSAIIEYAALDDKLSIARCCQNLAFISEEKLKDNVQALAYSKLALDLYEEKNDVLQTANLLKYVGHIYGNMGLYELGRNYIERSIRLYKEKKFESGQYVALFDLGLIDVSQNKCSNAIKHFLQVKKYWERNANGVRLFLVNTELIACLIRVDNMQVMQLIDENERLISSNKIPEDAQKRFASLKQRCKS